MKKPIAVNQQPIWTGRVPRRKFSLPIALWVTAGLALAVGIAALATNDLANAGRVRVNDQKAEESLSRIARTLPVQSLPSNLGLRELAGVAEKSMHERVLASHIPIIGPNHEPTNAYLAQGGSTGNHYAWDAENRLVQITYPGTGNNSQFTYDGESHFVKIAETTNGTVTDTKQFVWAGDELAEERDGSGNVSKRFFALGEQVNGTNYYYSKDHQGNVREMTDGTGTIVAEYTYDPWGVPSRIQGSMSASKGFCGYYKHLRSGLYLTVYRPYNPALARFITRDPIGEAGGVNLYAYAANDPINSRDPSGLLPPLPYEGESGNLGTIQPGQMYQPQTAGTVPVGRYGPPGQMCPASARPSWFPQQPLPRIPGQGGGPPRYSPTSPYPHTEVGTNPGNPQSGPYPQAREWGTNGQWQRDIDFTNHGAPDFHTDPHQHVPDATGGRGGPQPFP